MMEMGEIPLHDLNIPVLVFGFLMMLVLFGVLYRSLCIEGAAGLSNRGAPRRWYTENRFHSFGQLVEGTRLERGKG